MKLIAITGPTASGKTRQAVSVARAVGGEIVSADSRQVYRGMDIGTGKDIEEYGDVPVHLLDVRDAGYRYSLHEYLQDYERAEKDILARGKSVVLCGGSGMYLEGVLSGVQLPEVGKNEALRERLEGKSMEELAEILRSYGPLHNTTDITSPRRAIRAIEIADGGRLRNTEAKRRDALIILVDIPREDRRRRISERLRTRLDDGLIEEVRGLLDGGISAEDLEYYGLEYKYVTQCVTGRLSEAEMFTALETAIHQFAKRQMTWFRGMERRGYILHRIPWNLPESEFTGRVLELLAQDSECEV